MIYLYPFFVKKTGTRFFVGAEVPTTIFVPAFSVKSGYKIFNLPVLVVSTVRVILYSVYRVFLGCCYFALLYLDIFILIVGATVKVGCGRSLLYRTYYKHFSIL